MKNQEWKIVFKEKPCFSEMWVGTYNEFEKYKKTNEPDYENVMYFLLPNPEDDIPFDVNKQ